MFNYNSLVKSFVVLFAFYRSIKSTLLSPPYPHFVSVVGAKIIISGLSDFFYTHSFKLIQAIVIQSYCGRRIVSRFKFRSELYKAKQTNKQKKQKCLEWRNHANCFDLLLFNWYDMSGRYGCSFLPSSSI